MSRRTIGVALPIPDPWGAELQECRDQYGDPLAAAIPTHITLLGPQVVDGSELAEVEEHLRGVAELSAPFELHLRGAGTFRPVSPVVFVALAGGIAGCESLERRIRVGPLARPLVFPYHPHVTVAHDLSEDVLDKAYGDLSAYDATFTVWGFSLYEHGPDGVWRPQRDYPLGRPVPGPQPGDPGDTSGVA